MIDRPVQYVGLERMDGPLIFVRGVQGVGYDELVEVRDEQGNLRRGTVLELSGDIAVVQVLEGSSGLANEGTRVRFTGRPVSIRVSEAMLGRTFNGLGEPIDGGPPPLGGELRDVHGQPINPAAREYPREFIQTGVSVIDGSNSLIRGQKLPIFSGSGLPHNDLAAQIVRQATLRGEETRFALIMSAMGVKNDVAQFFRRSFENTGVLSRVGLFLSPADAPGVEQMMAPRAALTLAEHLAFDREMHVLVLMTDMTNYCDALREIACARGQIPTRKGYPGYLYSDLAELYERAGRIKGKDGSITLMPILTMPSDDISHPVPDLTGYITEGQIVMQRDLDHKGIYPPVAGLPSLSRLMKDGVGADSTREDHMDIAGQLFSAYADAEDVRALASVIGEEELSPQDQMYLEFADAFERDYVAQGEYENRTIEQTLDMAWDVAGMLPESELSQVSNDLIEKYYSREGRRDEEGDSES
ncbi:MAG: V-type ATP synthase subunit B [Candidatus Brocadiia bacterium]